MIPDSRPIEVLGTLKSFEEEKIALYTNEPSFREMPQIGL